MKKLSLKKIKSICNEIIDCAEKHKNCFFWTSPCNASSRRSKEFENIYDFEFEGKEYRVEQTLSMTCKNVYFINVVYRDGKKTTMTVIKNVLKKIEQSKMVK